MTPNESEITARLDRIAAQLGGVSAEALNALHACHADHPIGQGRARAERFRAAAFMLSRPRVKQAHVVWLNRMAEQFIAEGQS